MQEIVQLDHLLAMKHDPISCQFVISQIQKARNNRNVTLVWRHFAKTYE